MGKHEMRREYQRQYYLANKERLIARAAAWHKSHPENARATQRAYYTRNRERLLPINRAKCRRYYQANPEKYRKFAKDARDRLRLEFILEYGGKCQCCGELEFVFLTLEHKNRDGKAHRDSARSGHTPTGILKDLKRRGWPKDNYELLCFNCNRASWTLGVCPHRSKEKQTI